MVRKLKFHEQKLLRKVDFLQWKGDQTLHENKILRKYHIQKREDYTKYNKLCGQILRLVHKLSQLDPKDPVRVEHTQLLITKLYKMGLLSTPDRNTSLQTVKEKLTVSCFCRRRLPVVMQRSRMAETVREAVALVEQGHVRVGPERVSDPAYLVSRHMEDFITWSEGSKIKRHIENYNGTRDDYDELD
eukprot:Nk52_evm32s240 gene=Nk52_evmTU32s240